jgi:hypothetical protein
VTDEPTPEDFEQLVRSVAMGSGALGDRHRLDVVIAAPVRRDREGDASPSVWRALTVLYDRRPWDAHRF